MKKSPKKKAMPKKKLRVYLSLSKAAPVLLYKRVLEKFEYYSKTLGYELLYFKGGAYSTADLLSSDIVFVLPADKGEDKNTCLVGRGGYEEALIAENKNIQVYIIHEKNGLFYSSALCANYLYGRVDSNWQNKYGVLQFTDREEFFTDVISKYRASLNEVYPYTLNTSTVEETQSKTNSELLLLVKNK